MLVSTPIFGPFTPLCIESTSLAASHDYDAGNRSEVWFLESLLQCRLLPGKPAVAKTSQLLIIGSINQRRQIINHHHHHCNYRYRYYQHYKAQSQDPPKLLVLDIFEFKFSP